jgi:hypothetical protein
VALELADLLVPGAERAEREVVPADLAEFETGRTDRPLEVGDLKKHHVVAARLEPPAQGGQRVVVSRRRETQDADSALRPPLTGVPRACAVPYGLFGATDRFPPKDINSIL